MKACRDDADAVWWGSMEKILLHLLEHRQQVLDEVVARLVVDMQQSGRGW